MKRKELLKRSGSLALAFMLSAQYVPVYAEACNMAEDAVEATENREEPVVSEAISFEEEYQEEPVYEEMEELEAQVEEPVEEMQEAADAEEDTEAPADIYDDDDDPYYAPVPVVIELDYEESKIRDLILGEVETNSQYQYMSFLFGDNEGHVYEGYLTGIENFKEGIESFKDRLQYYVNRFLTRDEERWYNNWSILVSEVESIDAEKHVHDNTLGIEGESGYPYGEELLCWAATTSNMLEFADWKADFADEDEIFTAFANGFFDIGGFEYSGLEWYFDGIFPNQLMNESGEQVAFPDYMEDENGVTQQREFGTGGYYKEHSIQKVAKEETLTDNDFDPDIITENLKAGNAIGMDVDFVSESGFNCGAHALTVFGYIRDLTVSGMDGLKALFIADSDNDKYDFDCDITHKDAKETEEKRKEIWNTLTMQYLKSSDLLNYNSYDMYTYGGSAAIIRDFTILKAKASVTEEDMEKDGTMDALHDPDLVFHYMDDLNSIGDDIYEGEEVQLLVNTQNLSYTGFNKEDVPTVNFVISIYKDGEYQKDIYSSGLLVNDYNGMAMGPLGWNTQYVKLKFDEAGEYTVKVRIDSIVDKNGRIIQEAYTSNNETEVYYSIKKGSNPTQKPETTPEINVKPADKETVNQEKFCECLCSRFGIKCLCKECKKLVLRKDWIQHLVDEKEINYIIKEICNPEKINLPEKTVREDNKIHAFLDGEFFCETLYKVIEEEDGILVLEIDGEIMRKIGPGEHKLLIETEDGFFMYHLNIG